jgi:hypothetical protein
MGAKKCNIEDFRGKVGPWLDRQYIRQISLTGKNRLSVLFVDNVTDEFELEGCGSEEVESFLQQMKDRGIIITR